MPYRWKRDQNSCKFGYGISEFQQQLKSAVDGLFSYTFDAKTGQEAAGR
jgi:hypothetical protein